MGSVTEKVQRQRELAFYPMKVQSEGLRNKLTIVKLAGEEKHKLTVCTFHRSHTKYKTQRRGRFDVCKAHPSEFQKRIWVCRLWEVMAEVI